MTWFVCVCVCVIGELKGHWAHAERPGPFMHIVRGFFDATAVGRGLYHKQIDEQDEKFSPLP
jgi:hypothetical protein